MAKRLPLTQFNILFIIGYYPAMNQEISLIDYGGDSDICVHLEITREFNIEDQNYSEFWSNLRHEYWPQLE